MIDPVRERFMSKVTLNPMTGCWEWLACTDGAGYGMFRFEGRHHRAHRLWYQLTVGTIPPKLHTDHLCRNPGCVNPMHLEPVTVRVNILRGTAPAALNAKKTHCMRGHEFTEKNTYRVRGNRTCRTCAINKATAWNQAHKERRRDISAASYARRKSARSATTPETPMTFTTAQALALIDLIDRGVLVRSRSTVDGGVANRTAGFLLKNGLAVANAENALVPTREGKIAAKQIRKETAAA